MGQAGGARPGQPLRRHQANAAEGQRLEQATRGASAERPGGRGPDRRGRSGRSPREAPHNQGQVAPLPRPSLHGRTRWAADRRIPSLAGHRPRGRHDHLRQRGGQERARRRPAAPRRSGPSPAGMAEAMRGRQSGRRGLGLEAARPDLRRRPESGWDSQAGPELWPTSGRELVTAFVRIRAGPKRGGRERRTPADAAPDAGNDAFDLRRGPKRGSRGRAEKNVVARYLGPATGVRSWA